MITIFSQVNELEFQLKIARKEMELLIINYELIKEIFTTAKIQIEKMDNIREVVLNLSPTELYMMVWYEKPIERDTYSLSKVTNDDYKFFKKTTGIPWQLCVIEETELDIDTHHEETTHRVAMKLWLSMSRFKKILKERGLI